MNGTLTPWKPLLALLMTTLWYPVHTAAASGLPAPRPTVHGHPGRVQAIAPGPEELHRAARLFLAELTGDDGRTLAAGWRRLGFERTEAKDQAMARGCHLIQERTGRRTGRGTFLLCPMAGTRIALQIPHRYTDLDTGTLGQQMAREWPWVAVAWNSVPRNTPLDGGGTADLTHMPASYFNALIEALADSGLVMRIVQLHGFSQAKRRSPAARGAHLILSAGTHAPPQTLYAQAECLRRNLTEAARLFPDEVDELGAVTNVQGQVARQRGLEFIHVEMSRPLRQRLIGDIQARTTLIRCLSP